MTRITYVFVVFNRDSFPQMMDFSRLGPIQAVTYTVKVAVSRKCCNIDTLLLHITNRKYHIAYIFVQFPVTLDDLDGRSPVAGSSNAIRRTFMRHFARFQLTQCVARSLGDS